MSYNPKDQFDEIPDPFGEDLAPESSSSEADYSVVDTEPYYD